ncbi:MAG: alpha/beta hydrolase [Zetaproteobacteria bacterium]|nr:alpha/beta hydrolase [Zetaproteobacteria bacterium]
MVFYADQCTHKADASSLIANNHTRALFQPQRLLQVGATGAPLLLIPGALTTAEGLLPVAHVLAQHYRVGILNVSVPIGEDSFSFTQAIEFATKAAEHLATTGEKTLVVGESAGGLIGLELARTRSELLSGLVLADPPLAPAKLWHVRSAMQQAVQQAKQQGHGRTAQFFADFGHTLFGYALSDNQDEHEPLYYSALSQSPVPTLILTGDEPLWPARNTQRAPCILDEQDIWMLEQLDLPKLTVKRIRQADHIYLRRQPQACMRLIRCWLEDWHSDGSTMPSSS